MPTELEVPPIELDLSGSKQPGYREFEQKFLGSLPKTLRGESLS